MPDGTRLAAPRLRDEIRLSLRVRSGETVLDRLFQSGSLRARLPREGKRGWTSAVLINTGGGVVAGDELAVALAAREGAACTVTTQAAEKLYRALPGANPARLSTRITIAPGAALEYLPQETILFDGSAMTRHLHVGMAADAWFLGTESLVFGRMAKGETVHRARISDTITLHRDGRLLFRDALRLPEAVAAALDRPAIGKGARALATILLVCEDAERRIDDVREALGDADAGASAWNGMLVTRILAPDGAALRRIVTSVLRSLRDGRPEPRSWLC